MAESLEGLFEVGGEPILQNSIHALRTGPSMNVAMVIGYDPASKKSTWVTPSIGEQLMALELDSSLLAFRESPASHKRYLSFSGNQLLGGLVSPSILTQRQREIYTNWDVECEKAGYGGHWI